jgi:tetratricopeptide (TPR) repeat protein
MSIGNLAFCLLISIVWAAPARGEDIAHADALFGERDDTAKLRQAIAVLESGPRGNDTFDVLWRLAKYRYYEGARERDPGKQAKLLKASIRSARRACRLAPGRPDGHFWLAESYGEYADLKGASKALKLLPAIRHAYEAVLSIDADYENGAAYEELADLDIRVPSRLGGNQERGVELLERGLEAAPTNADVKVTLARAYAKSGRRDDARRLMEEVLALRDPLKTAAEQQRVNDKARHLLEELR